METIFLDNAGGTKIYNSSKHELMKNLDIINLAHQDQQTQQANKKLSKFMKLIVDISIQDSKKREQYEAIIVSSGSEGNSLIIKSIVCHLSCYHTEESKDHSPHALDKFPQSVFAKQSVNINQTQNLNSRRSVIPHIIISAYEHKSILNAVDQLQRENKIQLSKINPRSDGKMYSQDIIKSIKANTILISIICINNENGAINAQCLREIANYIKDNKKRIYLHSDFVQSYCKYPYYMDDLHLDAITCSFYKVYGPQRIGALVIKSDHLKKIINAFPLINGTLLQKQNNHGGTISYSLCVSSYNSLKITKINRQNKNDRLQFLKLYFLKEMSDYFIISDYCKQSEQIVFQQSPKWILINFSPFQFSVPHIIFFTLIRSIKKNNQQVLDGICGTKLKNYLSSKNIIVSTGSNCNINTNEHYVLDSYQVPNKLQQGVVRISISDNTIKYELDSIINEIKYYIDHIYK